MGKRLNKQALLAEVDSERCRLQETLEPLLPRQISQRNRNDAGWSIKDVLTHIIDWEIRTLSWYRDGRTDRAVELPAPGYKWSDIKALNEAIRRRHARKSVSTVLQEFHDTRESTVSAIADMTDEELTTLKYFEWTGNSWTLSDYLRANTASHDKWARTKIRRWLREERLQEQSK